MYVFLLHANGKGSNPQLPEGRIHVCKFHLELFHTRIALTQLLGTALLSRCLVISVLAHAGTMYKINYQDTNQSEAQIAAYRILPA